VAACLAAALGVLDRIDEPENTVAGLGSQVANPILFGNRAFGLLSGVAERALLGIFLQDDAERGRIAGKADLAVLVVDPDALDPLLTPDVRNDVCQILTVILQHRVMRRTLDEIADLNGMIAHIVLDLPREEIRVEEGDDKHKQQQDRQQEEQLRTDAEWERECSFHRAFKKLIIADFAHTRIRLFNHSVI